MKRDALELLKTLAQSSHKHIDIKLGDGFTIKLRSLTAKEETEVFAELDGYKGVTFFYNHKLATLCRSIIEINGNTFDIDVKSPKNFSTLPDDEKEVIRLDVEAKKEQLMQEKRAIISELPASVVDVLYKSYASMIGEQEQQFTPETIEELEKINNQL